MKFGKKSRFSKPAACMISAFDIIICTYNNCKLLGDTLAALEIMDKPAGCKLQVWVVNNNCTDATDQVIANYQQSGNLLITALIETQQGLTPARICGVKHSTAPWLAFVDDDGLVETNWLTNTLLFIDEHPQAGAFGGRILLQFPSDAPAYARKFPFLFAGKNLGDVPFTRNWVAGLGMTLRRDILLQTGWAQFPLLGDRVGKGTLSGGDMEIGLRVAQLAEVWYNPATTITHQIDSHRCNRTYLQNLSFGLSASSLYVAAIQWRGSKAAFILYSGFFGGALACYNFYKAIGDIFEGEKCIGWRFYKQAIFGWFKAYANLLVGDGNPRTGLIGSIYRAQLPK